MRIAPYLLLCLTLSVSAPALAVYKCESDGKVSYSDLPCDDAKPLDVDTRSPDASDASRKLAQEKNKLKKLEHERHKREAAEQRELKNASRKSAARHKKCNTYLRRLKWANEDVAASTGRANEKAKRKARRITEEYEAECGRWYERELSVAR